VSATTRALAELTPDRMVRQLAEVVRLGCRALADRDGREVPQELADLQVDLHVRAAAVQALVEAHRAQASSGQGGTKLAVTPEPEPRSRHDDEPQWLTTGEVHERTGLSSSYLRRLARKGHPAVRPSEQGHYLWRSDHLPVRGDGHNTAAAVAGEAA
jgi:hypothetical protein